jgi:microcystin-dependent protein
MESARHRHGQIRKKGLTLGLREHRVHRSAIRAAQLKTPKYLESNHLARRRNRENQVRLDAQVKTRTEHAANVCQLYGVTKDDDDWCVNLNLCDESGETMSPGLVSEIRAFTSNELPFGWLPCDGRELAIAEYQPLFALIGWRFGGDGATTFCLPALPVQSAQPAGAGTQPHALVHGIAVNGFYPTGDETMPDSPAVGEIRFFAGRRPPTGWVPCDGRVLPIEPPYMDLYDVVGTRWGRDPETFAVPDFWSEPGPTGEIGIGRLSYVVAVHAPLTDPRTTS